MPKTTSKPYDSKVCNRFVEDMTNCCIPVRHYCGRWHWTGPAACTTDEIREQDIIRATKVKLQKDNMGLDMIFYPVSSGNLINPEAMPRWEE